VKLLALTVADAQRPYEALTIGRARPGVKSADVTIARIAPLAAQPDERRELARAHLAAIVDLHDRGMREPLPLACLSSAAYARAAANRRDPVHAARSQWRSGFRFDGEDRQPEHELIHGGVVAFDDLLAERPRDGERGAGWQDGETTRFGRLACRLWHGLLAHEAVSDR
jgi:exodeoxyribonuclease V gamma subunit